MEYFLSCVTLGNISCLYFIIIFGFIKVLYQQCRLGVKSCLLGLGLGTLSSTVCQNYCFLELHRTIENLMELTLNLDHYGLCMRHWVTDVAQVGSMYKFCNCILLPHSLFCPGIPLSGNNLVELMRCLL